jgi:hypothetical protein
MMIHPTLWMQLFGQPPAPFDYYIDSVAGSDSNAGTSEAQAWATIGKLTSAAVLASGVKIGLKCGSSWRELLGNGTHSNVTVGSYGAGAKPVLRCDDVVSSFSAPTGGRTKAYETTWTPRETAGKTAPSVWQDGVLMTRVASAATCESTPGSFYAASTGLTLDTPATLYVHPTGSGDPNSNGRIYEKAVRTRGLWLGDFATVRGIRTKRNLHNNGSLEVGDYALLEDNIYEDGHVHNMLWKSGVQRRCWSVNSDPLISTFAATGGVMFVHYRTANDQPDVLYEDCGAMQTGATKNAQGGGFYGHGNTLHFGTVTYRRTISAYLSNHLDGTHANSYVVDGGLSYEVGVGIGFDSTQAMTVNKYEYFRLTTAGYTYNFGQRVANTALPAGRSITNSVFVTYDSVFQYSRGGTIALSNNLYYKAGSLNNRNAVETNNTGGTNITLTEDRNIYQNWSGQSNNFFHYFTPASGSVYTATNNVYSYFGQTSVWGKTRWLGANLDGPAAWLTNQQPGNEIGSVASSANQFSGDPAARVYALAGGSSAESLGAGPVGFTPIAFDYAAKSAELLAA